MKQSPLLFAALVPFAATANPGDAQSLQVDRQKLEGAVPVTVVLDEEVRAKDGRDLGDVEDILLTREGQVEYIMIERDEINTVDVDMDDDDDVIEDDTVTYRDTADLNSEDGEWTDDTFTLIEPRNVQLNAGDNAIRIDLNDEPLSSKPQRGEEDVESRDRMRASEVVGMEVNLADEDSFGRVEDVMLSKDGTEIVALVVDNWDGLDKQRRALPVEGAEFNYDDEEVTYRFDYDEVAQLPEFNLDQFDREGFFLDDF